MEFQAKETHAEAEEKPFWKQHHLFHAAFAQFCYTGAQVAIAGFFINYAEYTRPNTPPHIGAKFFAGAQAAFAVGRFAGVSLMKFFRPRLVFLGFLTMCIIFVGPSITQRQDTGIVMLYMVLFFESVCFPTIVALGMRGLGRHTKRGSGYIVGGVVGGACVPPLTGLAADRHGNGIAMVVPMMFLAAAWVYALCANFLPSYTRIIDSFGDAKIGIESVGHDEQNGAKGDEVGYPARGVSGSGNGEKGTVSTVS
jgi:FHS family L-fucose permease-like MFS transporter